MNFSQSLKTSKVFFQFIKRLKRSTFSNPQKSDVLVFDQMGIATIKKILLYDIENYTVLPIRNEVNYVSIQIIALTIKNLLQIAYQYKSKKLFHHKQLLYISWLTYLLSCVEYISPKVVLTFIDNSSSFQWISRHYTKTIFYAIQNGVREVRDRGEGYLMHSMPNFMCFGEFEKDSYIKCNCKVDNFYPVGSLKGGYYKYKLCNGLSVESDYDICLVSQFREQIMYGREFPEIKKAVNMLNTFLKKYIDENNSLMVNIACASSRDTEERYFEEAVGDRLHIIKNIPGEFTTYGYMDRSDVILTCHSTAGFEAFGWGKKVLFCHFFTEKEYLRLLSSLPDICTVDITDYDIFCAKLDYLRGLDDLTYRKMTEDAAKYFMNYDSQMPAHRFIRNKIFDIIH